jgi:hypothetical protein
MLLFLEKENEKIIINIKHHIIFYTVNVYLTFYKFYKIMDLNKSIGIGENYHRSFETWISSDITAPFHLSFANKSTSFFRFKRLPMASSLTKEIENKCLFLNSHQQQLVYLTNFSLA